MKANRKFVEGEEAVSAVIGVILMVAITVAIAATVYVYVSGMLGSGTKETPTVGLTAEATGEVCAVTISTVSKADIAWADVETTLTNVSGAKAHGTDPTVSGTYVTLSGGQIISCTNLDDGFDYRLTLTYESTGGTMGTVTWTQ